MGLRNILKGLVYNMIDDLSLRCCKILLLKIININRAILK